MSNKNIMKNSELKDSKMKNVSGGAGTIKLPPTGKVPAPATTTPAAGGGKSVSAGPGGVAFDATLNLGIDSKKFGYQSSVSGENAKSENNLNVKF